ncbi:MAG: DUF86 domain-containing protein [Deinococcota bacterium]|nr:DUF86 domain-containing protein [Deinococcota bacterium]
MPRSAKVCLFDVLKASDAIASFIASQTLDDYRDSLLLRSAVERQLAIIGEALNGALKLEPDLSQGVSHVRRIVDFRNLLVHAYASVSVPVVWDVLKTDLPILRREVEVLLKKLDEG